MAMVFFGLAGGGYMLYSDNVQQSAARRAAEQAQRDSVQALEAASRGSRVIAGLPDTVVAVINNKPYRNGDVFNADSGSYYVQVRARGFEELFQPFTVDAGRSDTLLLSLQKAAGAGTSSQPVQTSRTTVTARTLPVDSAEVRISVMPPHADIQVDGVRIGSGRVARKLPVGQHLLRYSAVNCDPEDRSITVSPGEPLLVPVLTLQCH
jgi:hypothetical protein